MEGSKNIIIIGCGAGGATAAQFARKTNRKAEITVFEKGPYPEYSKCGLPYAISDEIPKIMDLIEFDEEFFKKSKIDLFLNTTVKKIDKEKKIVTAENKDGEIKKEYDSLIICTGAKPFIPPIKNIKNKNNFVSGVHVVRTIDHAKQIKKLVKKNKNATIVGAGFIGLEMADNLYKKDMKVTIVEALPNILANIFDIDLAKMVLKNIPDDVNMYTNHLAAEIKTDDNKIKSVLIKNKENDDEKEIETDLLIIATGTKANTNLAETIGCKIGETGGIIVDKKSKTNVENVYAVGDCTEYFDYVTEKPLCIGLGSIVVRQAISAGINAAGGEYNLFKGFLQTCTSDFFDMEVAAVGAPSCFLEEDKIISSKYNGESLPEYFPGGKKISIKVTVDLDTGKILKAQAIGDKAAKRINTFASAIIGDLDIDTFRKIETAYAPPIAPTLDAETLVCDIAQMKLSRKKRK